MFFWDLHVAETQSIKEIQRNSYGKGDKKEAVTVYSEREGKQKIEVEVDEQIYSKEEVESLFQTAPARLEPLVLGKGQSADHVEKDLNLVSVIPGMPVHISWELSRYDVIGLDGKLVQDQLDKKGSLVTLTATMTSTDQPQMQAIHSINVLVFPKKERGLFSNVIKEEIERIDQETKEDDVLTLPNQYQGETITFYKALDLRGLILAAMAGISFILVLLAEKENENKKESKRKEELQRDYPEIVNKLTLFLGAGMTVKRAWQKMVFDYKKEKETRGVRIAYEEMDQALHEMESGVLESECYENFGQRCRTQEYIHLGALLSQNLRKGTTGISKLLHAEAVQSFEERKARAKQLGEEASTKLLAPMFLMLAVVLVIVIVPAFLSIQM